MAFSLTASSSILHSLSPNEWWILFSHAKPNGFYIIHRQGIHLGICDTHVSNPGAKQKNKKSIYQVFIIGCMMRF